MKLIYFALVLMFSSLSFAKECQLNSEEVSLEWTAFKTPLKVGVGGKFTELGLNKIKGNKLKDFLEGIKFKIDTNTTVTGNEGRDAKIVKYFFKNMNGSTDITGETVSYAKKVLTVRINMNKYTRDVPLKVTNQNGVITANGVIDVFDFGLNKSLAGINKACEELHQGKTWSDVEVKLTINYKKDC